MNTVKLFFSRLLTYFLTGILYSMQFIHIAFRKRVGGGKKRRNELNFIIGNHEECRARACILSYEYFCLLLGYILSSSVFSALSRGYHCSMCTYWFHVAMGFSSNNLCRPTYCCMNTLGRKELNSRKSIRSERLKNIQSGCIPMLHKSEMNTFTINSQNIY